VSEPKSAPSLEAFEAREVLLALLEVAYGSADEARWALERALRHASRDELPSSAPAILAFVRTGLVAVLTDDLGPRLAMTLVDDFIADQEVRSGVRERPELPPLPTSPNASHVRVRQPPAPRPRRPHLLLVYADHVGRPALARALLRAGCQVTVVDSVEELGVVIRSRDEVDVAIVDGGHPAKLLLMELIVDRFPKVALIVRSSGEAATRALLGALGVARFDVLPGDASWETLIDAVLAVIPRG
jgi:hypothetical protein